MLLELPLTRCADRSGASPIFAFMPYGQWWRRHRRAFWQFFHQDASVQYQPTQESATHIFLEMLLESPSRLGPLVRL